MTDSITLNIKEIIAHQALLDVDDIDDEATLESLGLDSLGLVETIFAIEETFDITVPFNSNDTASKEFDITSVASVIAAVSRIVAAKRAA